MNNLEPQLCWGNCGNWIYFQTVSNRGRRRVVAFETKTDQPHSCPRQLAPPVFVPAMANFGELRKCDCGEMVYEIPVSSGHYRKEIIQFNQIEWPWNEHNCPKHPALPEILDFSLRKLSDSCAELNLPKPYQLVIVLCQKNISQNSPERIVALKTAFGEKFCCRFVGEGKIRWGDFSALCGSGMDQKLLTMTKAIFQFEGDERPEHLSLSHRWLEN